MKIELTREQAAFLIRALECSCAEDQSDFDPKMPGDRGPGGLIIGWLAPLVVKELSVMFRQYEFSVNIGIVPL